MATNGHRCNQQQPSSDAASGVFAIGKPKFKIPNSVRIQHDFVSNKFAKKMEYELERVNRSLEMSKENPMRRDAIEKDAMTQELKQIKHAEFIQRKKRQQLRQDCEELRDLAEQLRLAAISKGIADDLKERKRLRQLTVKTEAQEAAEERCLLEAQEREREAAFKEKQRQLRDSLTAQMEENRQRRQKEHAQVMNDREFMLARQKQIQEEDRAQELEMERIKMQKRRDMMQSIQDKKDAKEFERNQKLLEFKQLLQNQSDIEESKRRLDIERLEMQRKREEISIRLGFEVQEVENQKRHRTNLLLDLLEAEYMAKSDERFRQQLQQEVMSRKRTKQELELYRLEVEHRKMEEMKQKRAEMKTRQEEFPKNLQEQEREKQLQDYRQRRAHGSTLLAMIEDNQKKRAEAAAENVQYFDMKAKSDAELQERIKKERLHMLGQVPASVLRYLPNHVLTSTDREHFLISQDDKTMGGGDS
ncbi:meiosis-specific nuclear structural protein 1 [Drosophila bipectinata]|uniref:meiosis-specific nuclear structural protein 1 n=1 Tax=Drosophila bipectinata TaxID=42026 RepID=UPI001C8A1205|nr:trichohyalin [Drosophila bipectinata]